MFYLGVFTGFMASVILGICGAVFAHSILRREIAVQSGVREIITPKKSARGKKTPKFVSEEEQWKREQKLPPLDPGLG